MSERQTFTCENCKYFNCDGNICTNKKSKNYGAKMRECDTCSKCWDDSQKDETLSSGYIHSPTALGTLIAAPINLIIWIVKKIRNR
jgi:hypothetical protein